MKSCPKAKSLQKPFFFYTMCKEERWMSMLSPDKLRRINELSRKSKAAGLSLEEAKEQSALRQEYLQTFRETMRGTIENVKVIDPNGNDVTPDKVKNIREKKYLN
jgi:uncharacterized protein YnzC (UPF0291/DUF896 family)